MLFVLEIALSQKTASLDRIDSNKDYVQNKDINKLKKFKTKPFR